MRLSVPKAFCVLRGAATPSRDVALEIFRFVRERLPAYKRVRRLEFRDLPKTISGKIRRVELRMLEQRRSTTGERGELEFREEDFQELRSTRSGAVERT
jgi:acetyl-CoA synthetase